MTKEKIVSCNQRWKKFFKFDRLLNPHFSNSDGFSLAEIMVAAGMLGVLSLGVTQLMQNSAKTEKRLSQQVNLITLDSQIMDALLDTTSCERTLGITGGANPPANTGGAWQNLPTGTIYRGNNPEVGNLSARWNRVVQTYDGTAGVYGQGSNTVYIKNIQYAGFLRPGVDNAYNDPANYDAASRSPIPGTTDFYGTIVIHVDFRRGNPASYEALADDDERALKARKSSYGNYKVPRYYKVNVRVNNANNIVSCYAYSEIMSDTYCSLFDGYLDPATGKCTNVKFRSSPLEPSTPPSLWAITAKTEDGINGNSLVQGGMRVGGNLTDDPPEEGDLRVIRHSQFDGNLSIGETGQSTPGNTTDDLIPTIATPTSTGFLGVEKDAIIGRDAQVNRQFRSVQEALFQGKVNIGPATMNPGNYLMRVDQSSNTDLVTFIGNGANASEVRINESVSTNGKIELNNNGSEPLRILEGTNLVFKVSQNGRIDFYNGNGGGDNTAIIRNDGQFDLLNSSGDTVVSIGDGAFGSNYRPIKIFNQPTNVADMQLPNSSVASEVPTKAWVRTMVFGQYNDEYNDTDIQNILNSIEEYAQHHTIEQIASTMCTKMNLRWGTGTNSLGRSYCTYTSGQCYCNPVNCSDELANGRKVCEDIYLSGRIDADGQIHSDTNISANGNIVAGGNITTENGRVKGETVVADSFSRAQKFFTATNGITGSATGPGWVYANRLQAKDRTCVTGGGCYTKFGKFMCPYRHVMVGIAYGQPICTVVGP